MRRAGINGDIAVTQEEWFDGWHGWANPDLWTSPDPPYRRFQRYAEQGDEVLLCPRPVYTERGEG